MFKRFAIGLAFLITGLLGMQSGLWAATYTVTNNNAFGAGSLYQAVQDANGNSGPDSIDISVGNSITVHAILGITGPVDIRGNSTVVGSHNGIGSDPNTCFNFMAGSSGSTLTGVSVVDSMVGISLQSNNNWILGCRVGLNYAEVPHGNLVGIQDTGSFNYIGSTNFPDRNVIAGNTTNISLQASVSSRIQGNYIGTNSSGTVAVSGSGIGVVMSFTLGALVGGNRVNDEGNLISGNAFQGVVIQNDSTGNTVCGNIIGLNAAESGTLSSQVGVYVLNCHNNAIGLAVGNHENVIASNTNYNIQISAGGGTPVRPRNNVVQNNIIGLNSSGTSFTNGDGIYLNNADNNLIGGNRNSLERNVISANTGNGGLYVIGNANTICGNFIGTDVSGSVTRPNSIGVRITGSGNLIGGHNQGGIVKGNVISGNTSHGVYIGSGSSNTIAGNYIGLNSGGTAGMGNQNRGVRTETSVSRTLIGGPVAGQRNVIAANTWQGIYLLGDSHQVIGNYVGTNAAGTATLLNGSGSVALNSSRYNFFSGNYLSRRLSIWGTGSFGNTVAGNYIGIRPDGTTTGSTLNVSLFQGAHGNFIGLPGGQGNLITDASQAGIEVDGGATTSNALYGNTITAFGTDGIFLDNDGNLNHPAPIITGALAGSLIYGTSSPNDYIEVFLAEPAAGNGGSILYLGAGTADGSGNWSVSASGFSAGQYVCALATDPNNNTSQFSANALAFVPTPSATPTISPTATITPTITVTATISPTSTTTPTQTPTPTNVLSNVDLNGKQVLAYPNPATGQMTFVFHVAQAADIKILIYNLAGERVAELTGDFAAGQGQTLIWGCGDVAPGIYLARYLVAGEVKETVKIAVVK